jgi:hypothetical protein
MLRMADPLEAIFILEGIETNSMGLCSICCYYGEDVFESGPQITADYLAKVNSRSRS